MDQLIEGIFADSSADGPDEKVPAVNLHKNRS